MFHDLFELIYIILPHFYTMRDVYYVRQTRNPEIRNLQGFTQLSLASWLSPPGYTMAVVVAGNVF